MTLTWTQARWDAETGPWSLRDAAWTPSGFLATNRETGLWRSTDGVAWERDPSLGGLIDIALTDARTYVLASGSVDGRPVLLRTDDGASWTEIDVSGTGETGRIMVEAATPNGLVWLRPVGDGSGAGVIAILAGDRVVDSHTPPWDVSDTVELVELGGTVTAYQDDSDAWQYLGNGEWTQAQPIPISSHHAQLGGTVLMYDHSDRECCEQPEPTASQQSLLATNDGINWTEIATIESDHDGGLQVNAGASFWVYGLHGYGGNDIERYRSFATLWISRDGRIWEPVDISFTQWHSIVYVVGDTIFVGGAGAGTDTDHYWVGTLREQ